MKYTVQFNIDIDSDEIFTEQEVEDYIKESLEGTNISINEFKLIEVND